MPNITGPNLTFPTRSFPGSTTAGSPVGIVGDALFSEILPKYSTLAKSGRLFHGYATLTAPVIFSTAAGTGGPLIWNNSGTNDVHLIAMSVATVVASAVAGGIGITVGSTQTAAPGSTTAIDASGNLLSNGPASSVSVFRVGTPTTAGAKFFPVMNVDTGALTVQLNVPTWVDLGGAFVITPNTWGSVTASATLTTAQLSVGLIWAELPA